MLITAMLSVVAVQCCVEPRMFRFSLFLLLSYQGEGEARSW